MMSLPLRDVCCASLSADQLPVLADLRAAPGITVAQTGGRAWVRWETGDEQVLRRLWPVAGVELYVSRGGRWYRFGRSLPALDFPANLEYRPLHQVLFPAPVLPVPPQQQPLRPVPLLLVPDQQPRPAAALTCPIADLARWAETASEVRLQTLRGAYTTLRVLVLGERLPELASGQRFWGGLLLVPLGWRVEPELPASAVRDALGAGPEDLLLLTPDGGDIVPGRALTSLTRAQIRLARRADD
jgi:hypothetical protein